MVGATAKRRTAVLPGAIILATRGTRGATMASNGCLAGLAGTTAGLGAGAAVSAFLLVRDLLTPGRGIKLLELGTLLLFGFLALYALDAHPPWSVAAVRLRVDAGLMLVVLASMALRRPFSLQYARERVDKAHWNSPAFLHVNYVISAAWALAFGVLVLADLAMA